MTSFRPKAKTKKTLGTLPPIPPRLASGSRALLNAQNNSLRCSIFVNHKGFAHAKIMRVIDKFTVFPLNILVILQRLWYNKGVVRKGHLCCNKQIFWRGYDVF